MLRPLAQAAALSLAVALAFPATAQTQPPSTTLAEFPNGAFLENLIVRADGTVIFTSYFDRTLMSLAPGGRPKVLARLPAHPVGLSEHGGGFVVSAHGKPFTAQPDFLSTNLVLELDRAGKVVRSTPAPDGRFLNGVLNDGRGFLIADSIAGAIWRYTLGGGVQPWLRAQALEPDPATTPFRPGANGLKLHDGSVYVSNTSRGAISRVRLSAEGSPGALEPVASPGPVDDFAFDHRGVLYGTTHGDQLIALSPAGEVSVVLSDGCDGCTSVALRDGRLIVLTTGALLEGGKKPARVLSIPLKR
jgi:sugar lactone lactonase YvrE